MRRAGTHEMLSKDCFSTSSSLMRSRTPLPNTVMSLSLLCGRAPRGGRVNISLRRLRAGCEAMRRRGSRSSRFAHDAGNLTTASVLRALPQDSSHSHLAQTCAQTCPQTCPQTFRARLLELSGLPFVLRGVFFFCLQFFFSNLPFRLPVAGDGSQSLSSFFLSNWPRLAVAGRGWLGLPAGAADATAADGGGQPGPSAAMRRPRLAALLCALLMCSPGAGRALRPMHRAAAKHRQPPAAARHHRKHAPLPAPHGAPVRARQPRCPLPG